MTHLSLHQTGKARYRHSTALYKLFIPSRELTYPWYVLSPWGDLGQQAAYISLRACTSAILPYVSLVPILHLSMVKHFYDLRRHAQHLHQE